jgi:putative phosphoserine phosphatase/1-acylglycerol-3-phosphate O-acyltransferase
VTSLGRLLNDVGAASTGPQTTAFFDLDGTLVSGYTAGAFYRDRMRRGAVGLGEFGRSLAVIADSKLLGGDPAKLGPIAVEGLRGRQLADLEELGERLYEERISRMLRPEIRMLLEAHQDRGHTVVIASSATHFQVDPVARELGVEHVLCSEVSVEDGKLTGRFIDGMLWDGAKAAAVRSFAREHGSELTGAYAYANGDEDISLLSSVGHPRAIAPDLLLERVARQEDWPILHLPDEQGTGARSVVGTAAAAAGINLSLGVGAVAGLIRGRRAGANLAGRFAFDVALRLAGVRLNVIGEENLWSARPAVFVFNHQSNLDPIVAGALIRRDFTSTGKKEAQRDPMAALAGYVLDAVFLDREDPERAKEQINEAVDRLRNGVSVMIAPEGTRSRTDIPGPYKHGAFHVAMAAGVPIVPIVLRNSGERMPRGSTFIHPGTLDVRVLEPILTKGWGPRDPARAAEALQRRTADLVAGVEEWEPAPPPDAKQRRVG